MKSIVLGISFIVWALLTVVLTLSIVGMLLFIVKDQWKNQENTPSTWMAIGKTLINEIVK